MLIIRIHVQNSEAANSKYFKICMKVNLIYNTCTIIILLLKGHRQGQSRSQPLLLPRIHCP